MSSEDEVKEFLDAFPTRFNHEIPKSSDDLWVFWTQDDNEILLLQQPVEQQRFQINNNNYNININDSVSADGRMMISDKIKHAFLCAHVYDKVSIIQFWAPVMTISGGRHLLSTSGQPFAVKYPSKELSKYRLRCMEYQYSIDDDHNPLPELVGFEKLKGASNPLVDSALECCLRYSYMLPICFPSQTPSSCCLGVLELSTSSLLPNERIIAMIRALKDVGLGVCRIQEQIPYQIIHGLKPARDEIQQALKIVCESNNTPLAQVWISFKDDNHVPFPSYLVGTRKKQMSSLKLTGYLDDTGSKGFVWIYGEYYRLCDMFPLEMGEGFVEKTLEDYKPRFCNDVSKLSGAMLVKEFVVTDVFSRLAICLNSIHTGDFCYAFEFIWRDARGSDVKFVEELLLTLKKLLPSFKLASGAEVGDELDFINVGDSTATETKFLKIFQGKRLSPIPEVLEEGRRIPVPMVVESIAPLEAKYKKTTVPLSREVIEQQFGDTETEAAENLKVSRSTLRCCSRKPGILKLKGQSKRKANDLYSNESDTNEEDTRPIPEPLPINRSEHTLTIKAQYAGDMIKFRLPVFEATFKTVMEEIGKRLKLTPGSYEVKYLDEDKVWILLTSEQDIRDCIKASRDSDQTAVRLHVELST